MWCSNEYTNRNNNQQRRHICDDKPYEDLRVFAERKLLGQIREELIAVGFRLDVFGEGLKKNAAWCDITSAHIRVIQQKLTSNLSEVTTTVSDQVIDDGIVAILPCDDTIPEICSHNRDKRQVRNEPEKWRTADLEDIIDVFAVFRFSDDNHDDPDHDKHVNDPSEHYDRRVHVCAVLIICVVQNVLCLRAIDVELLNEGSDRQHIELWIQRDCLCHLVDEICELLDESVECTMVVLPKLIGPVHDTEHNEKDEYEENNKNQGKILAFGDTFPCFV